MSFRGRFLYGHLASPPLDSGHFACRPRSVRCCPGCDPRPVRNLRWNDSAVNEYFNLVVLFDALYTGPLAMLRCTNSWIPQENWCRPATTDAPSSSRAAESARRSYPDWPPFARVARPRGSRHHRRAAQSGGRGRIPKWLVFPTHSRSKELFKTLSKQHLRGALPRSTRVARPADEQAVRGTADPAAQAGKHAAILAQAQ